MRFGILFASVVSLPFLFVAAAPTESETIGGLTTGEIINLLGIGIVQDIDVTITLESLLDNQVSVNFDAKNPLPFELTIDRVVSSAGLNGTVFATFDHTFSTLLSTPFVIPPLGTANSGTFNNVTLTQGAMATLVIIPEGVLDLTNTNVFVRAGTIQGKLGFPLQIDGLKQSSVPTT
ncbi:hypothetical protein J132_04208 [Termitomyces sp. J132]|nr:hypothetical protein C0989_002653 [Termitomyces sp. Mn162]KNZ82247.1 hypothetical protein J132_04208 [Termitomyces sp. J132]